MLKTAEAVNLFIQSRVSRNLSPESVKWYRQMLGRYAVNFKKLPRKSDQVEKFLISQPVGDERRHGYYRALKCFYRFLVKRKYLKYNPVQDLEEPVTSVKDPPVLLPQQLHKIFNHNHDSKVRAALLMFIDTGARLGEVAGMTIDSLFETPDGYTAALSGKTGDRTVPISYETYHALMVSLPFGLSRRQLRRRIKKACRDAGVKATPLTFRHTFGTLWEGDELVLQRIMGHTSLTTTRRYRHLRSRTMIEQHNKYSPLRIIFGASRDML